MSAMGMMGARFFEGNDGSGNDGKPGGEDSGDGSKTEAPNEGKPDGEGKPAGDGKPADGEPTGDEGNGESELGPAGKRALDTERTARKKAEQTLADRDATIAAKDTEIEKLTKDFKASESAKDAEISVLKLALETGLREKDDLALLASVSDAGQREALAKRLSAKAPASSPVTPSGTSDGDGPNPSGGSVAAGREMYQNTKTKKKVGA